jgi:polyisoprenoid-binding protein YceI
MKNLFIYTFAAAALCLTSCEKDEVVKTDNFSLTENANNQEANNTGKYTLTSQSVAEWNGSGPSANHIGTFAVESTDIKVKKDKLHSGSFVIPIASITNFDLPEEVKPILLNHLKSADFFNMAIYPEATFNITDVQAYTGGEPTAIAQANTLITGNFTMLGQTHAISFPAKVAINNGKLQAEAKLVLDRTQWGMNYGADPALGDHHIYPNVNIHLKLVGNNK